MPDRFVLKTRRSPVRVLVCWLLVLCCASLTLSAETSCRSDVDDAVSQALCRLYNFDFAGSHQSLDRQIEDHPADPIGPALRSSVYLFYELDRLGILESEFFLDDGRRLDRRKLQPDPEVRMKLMAAVEQARHLALAKLETDPEDPQALFCLSVASGMMADYIALVQKQRLRSLSYAKQSHTYAVRLLRADPAFHDAYLTTGLSEYLVSSLPFFVRWFVRFEQVRGSKKQAVENLQRVAASGRYLGPFARILLVVIHLRDKQFGPAHELLSELTEQFPGNALFRRELAELSKRVRAPTGDRGEGNRDGF